MSTLRIPTTEITGLFGVVVRRFAKRQLGEVPEAIGVMGHSKPLMKTYMSLGGKAKKWDACDPNLKSFAHMAVSSLIGCSFCLDYAYFEAHNAKLDVDKAREVPRWRQSTAFTPLERDVMEYAEAMSQTPPTVTDELSERLLTALGAPALLELTGYIAVANLMARTNTALGVEAAGLSASCRRRGCAGPRSTSPRSASRAPTWSGSSRARRSTGCGR